MSMDKAYEIELNQDNKREKRKEMKENQGNIINSNNLENTNDLCVTKDERVEIENYLAISNKEIIHIEAPDELTAQVAAYRYFSKKYLTETKLFKECDHATQRMAEDSYFKGIAIVKRPEKMKHFVVKEKVSESE